MVMVLPPCLRGRAPTWLSSMQQQEITRLVEFLLRVPPAGFGYPHNTPSIVFREKNDGGPDPPTLLAAVRFRPGRLLHPKPPQRRLQLAPQSQRTDTAH